MCTAQLYYQQETTWWFSHEEGKIEISTCDWHNYTLLQQLKEFM